jgi:Zn-dependent protease with chaperone function
MRVLLLILLFVIWESAADAPLSSVSPSLGATLLVSGYLLLIGVTRLWGGRVAWGRGGYGRLGRRVDRFNLGMGLARGLVPAWFAVGVFSLGWRHTVDHLLGHVPGGLGRLETPGVVIGLLPGFLGWAGLWWSQYPVDRAVREQGVLAQLEADLPVFAPPPFASYFANKLRVQLLFTVVPVLLILALHDAANLGVRAAIASGRLGGRWSQPGRAESVDSALYVTTVVLVLLMVPAILRHVLSTRRLPDGRLRDGLTDVLRLAGVRCREVLLWDTHNNLGNAAVMGLLPPVRYVLLSDLLLESMTDEQVQAVFAHELGHVHHRHLAWFTGVLGTGMAALSVGGDWLLDRLNPTTSAASVELQGGMVVVMVAAVWVGYGTLSRWFERQADVYAVRLMRQVGPPERGAGAFASALERVAVVNNIPLAARNWTHGSMATRVAFVGRLAVDPALARRFDRTGRRVRAGLWALMLACGTVAAIGLYHGYATPN